MIQIIKMPMESDPEPFFSKPLSSQPGKLTGLWNNVSSYTENG